MTAPTPTLARAAGALYLLLIACGIGSEGLVRSSLSVPGDAAATAANVIAHGAALRWSILADVVMALADVGLGVVLLVLLWRVGSGLAIAATAFRLVQASVLGLNLSFLMAALPLATMDGGQPLAALALELHGVGYDLGLFFFGVNSILTGVLLSRAGFPRWISAGLAAAGVVYLTGSTLTVVAPHLGDGFAPAYVVPLLSELAVALWLIARAPVPHDETSARPARPQLA